MVYRGIFQNKVKENRVNLHAAFSPGEAVAVHQSWVFSLKECCFEYALFISDCFAVV